MKRGIFKTNTQYTTQTIPEAFGLNKNKQQTTSNNLKLNIFQFYNMFDVPTFLRYTTTKAHRNVLDTLFASGQWDCFNEIFSFVFQFRDGFWVIISLIIRFTSGFYSVKISKSPLSFRNRSCFDKKSTILRRSSCVYILHRNKPQIQQKHFPNIVFLCR